MRRSSMLMLPHHRQLKSQAPDLPARAQFSATTSAHQPCSSGGDGHFAAVEIYITLGLDGGQLQTSLIRVIRRCPASRMLLQYLLCAA